MSDDIIDIRLYPPESLSPARESQRVESPLRCWLCGGEITFLHPRWYSKDLKRIHTWCIKDLADPKSAFQEKP